MLFHVPWGIQKRDEKFKTFCVKKISFIAFLSRRRVNGFLKGCNKY